MNPPNRRPRLRSVAWAALALLSALAVGGAFAQAPASASTTGAGARAPDRVEVIGAAPLPGLDLPRDQVPANVQTARAAEIERAHAADLSAFLNRRLGSVHLNEVQSNPFQPDVNFRGFTASPLLGMAQGLSVYLDGVRLNQPFGDVVSWDLLPKAAIASITLMPGSNPLFGLNTLGGALSVQTKDGRKNPGSSVQLSAGSHRRAALEFESGGSREGGSAPHWYVTGQKLDEAGWRADSPSRVNQLFGKFGGRVGDTSLTLSAALADNRLNGNGLQEGRLLAADRSSVYTRPDSTHNRGLSLNLSASRPLSQHWALAGQLYARRLSTRTLNGDMNEDALGQNLYQPDDDEQAALSAAGYSGFPALGESQANTPFPKWRCIANALRVDEPAEKCNGVLNTSHTRQRNSGFGLQLASDAPLAGRSNRLVVGVALDDSRVDFTQASELGYLLPDHGVVGVGAFGDGVTGGDADGLPYDTRVDLLARTRTWSLLASNTLALDRRTHLTVSGRYNRSQITNRDRITPGGGPGSLDGDHVFSRFNPALGLTWASSPQLTLYGGANQGSRAPSAIELGCADPANPCKLPNAMAGDPPLKQVVTSTLELGARGQWGGGAEGGQHGVRWNLGLFRADSRDDILFVAGSQSGYGYFKNFGQTRRQGLELGLATTLAGVNLSANLTWLDATYRSAELVNGAGNSSNDSALAGEPGLDGNIAVRPGDRIPLVPRQILKLSAEWPLSASLSLAADVQAVGGSLARGNENNGHQPDGQYYLGAGRSPGYALLNLGADWRPTDRLTVFVQINNLLDRRYTTAAQLGATGFDAQGRFVSRPLPAPASGDWPRVNSTFYAAGAPRAVQAGLRYQFGR